MSEPIYLASSAIDQAVEAVIALMNATSPFSSITRGALPVSHGITCEVGPSSPHTVYMDKNIYLPIDLTLNGKHENLQTVTDAMNLIHSTLTRARSYPRGTNWRIVDITNITMPHVIGREENNMWLLASALYIKIYQEGD